MKFRHLPLVLFACAALFAASSAHAQLTWDATVTGTATSKLFVDLKVIQN